MIMKILDFSPYYPPHIGGLEKYAEELHENLAQKGCRITVFTPRLPLNSPVKELEAGIDIIRYPAIEIIPNFPFPAFWKKEFWQLREEIKNENYDVVISTLRFFVPAVMAHFCARKKKVPRLHIEHGSDFVKGTFFITLIARAYDHTFGRMVLRGASRIIAPSESAKRFVKLLSGKDAPVIYRGMPFFEIDAIAPKNDLREKYPDKKIISYVGRLIYGKGVIHLLEAIKYLNRRDITTFIVGDGPEMENLKSYAKKNNISEQVVFLGSVPFTEAVSILKVSDVFVNPSYNEGLPTSVLEAGTCRRAILATNVGGTPEIITHEKSGLLISPRDVKELKNNLLKLIDNPELGRQLGESAREEIEKKFNWETSVQAYLREIESVIKK